VVRPEPESDPPKRSSLEKRAYWAALNERASQLAFLACPLSAAVGGWIAGTPGAGFCAAFSGAIFGSIVSRRAKTHRTALLHQSKGPSPSSSKGPGATRP